jgi:hypothetical protein
MVPPPPAAGLTLPTLAQLLVDTGSTRLGYRASTIGALLPPSAALLPAAEPLLPLLPLPPPLPPLPPLGVVGAAGRKKSSMPLGSKFCVRMHPLPPA